MTEAAACCSGKSELRFDMLNTSSASEERDSVFEKKTGLSSEMRKVLSEQFDDLSSTVRYEQNHKMSEYERNLNERFQEKMSEYEKNLDERFQEKMSEMTIRFERHMLSDMNVQHILKKTPESSSAYSSRDECMKKIRELEQQKSELEEKNSRLVLEVKQLRNDKKKFEEKMKVAKSFFHSDDKSECESSSAEESLELPERPSCSSLWSDQVEEEKKNCHMREH